MTARDLAKLGGALLIGVAVAFPAGMMFAEHESPAGGYLRQIAGAPARKVYSPVILDDPYFLDQQRRNIEALEASCRQSGELCAEARQARRWLNKQLSRD